MERWGEAAADIIFDHSPAGRCINNSLYGVVDRSNKQPKLWLALRVLKTNRLNHFISRLDWWSAITRQITKAGRELSRWLCIRRRISRVGRRSQRALVFPSNANRRVYSFEQPGYLFA